MTTRIAWLLTVGLLVSTGGSIRADDKEKLQGTWIVEKAVENGMELPAKERESIKVEFKGDKMLLYEDKTPDSNGFTLEPGKTPKLISVTPDKKGEKPISGIYELAGDSLKICFSRQGQKPPTEFSSTKESGSLRLILKREKK